MAIIAEVDFKRKLAVFVRDKAGDNKAEAARMLGITRAEVHEYLSDRKPRRDKKARLEAIISQEPSVAAMDDLSTSVPKVDDIEASGLAYKLIRYLYELLEDAHTRSRP